MVRSHHTAPVDLISEFEYNDRKEINMKTLVQDNRGYRVFASLTDGGVPGMKCLKVTSSFDGSKNPTEERTLFEILLSQEGKENLVSLLS